MSIWTEDENTERAIETMMNPKGRSCFNCVWGEGNMDKSIRSKDFTTCGHHHDNFSVNSLCGYWTSPDNPILKAYRRKKKDELLQKIKAKKKN